MALKDVKTTRSGSKGKGRYVTREEAKGSSKKIRRHEDELAELDMPVEPPYQPRFVTEDQLLQLSELYRLAQTALPMAGKEATRLARMQWAAEAFNKAEPTISVNAAYKDLSNSLASMVTL